MPCGGATATWRIVELQSNYGHDAFLVDVAEQTRSGARLPGQHVREGAMTAQAPKQAFVRELLGRSDYAIIGEIVEPDTKVLDLGCGEGELLEWLAANKGVDARGVEMSGAQGAAGDRPRRFRLPGRHR